MPSSVSSTTPFQLQLEKGWNQIGNPFPFDISWTDVMIANGNPVGVGSLKVFNAETIGFVESDMLKAWSGGFVKADNAVVFSFPVSLKNRSGRVANGRKESHDIDGDEWTIPFIVRQGRAENSLAAIGMATDASVGRDRNDEETIPRFVKYLEFRTAKNKFTKDIVLSAGRYVWDIEVNSNFGTGDITVEWDHATLAQSNAAIVLYDPSTGTLVDMKKFSSFNAGDVQHRIIRIFYDKEGKVAAENDIIGSIYPNPASASSSFVLPVLVSDNGTIDVEVRVMNASGQPVMSKIYPELRVGLTELKFELDQANIPVGLYYYQTITPRGSSRFQKLIIK